jgi:hypothetical protein
MKKTIYLLNLVPLVALGQIPVTDAATNGSLGIANNQLVQIHMQLRSLGNRLAVTNRKLDRLVDLMEKNNDQTSRSREILKEELDAMKTAPDYVLQSTELTNIIELKEMILEAYRTTRQTMENLKYMDSKETNEFLAIATNAVMRTKDLFQQSSTMLNTRSIISPEERLKKIDDITDKLKTVLEELTAHNKRIKRLDASRGIRKTLIDLNR